MRIDEYRKDADLSQKAFGQLLKPPASPSLVSQWECGVTRVTLDYSLQIQRVSKGRVMPKDCADMHKSAA